MNQFFLILFVIVLCGGAYMRAQKPREWNQFLEVLKAPSATGSSGALDSSTNSSYPGTSDSNSSDSTSSSASAPRQNPNAPVYVNPAPGTPIHSSHIIDVPQPSQADHASAKVFVAPNPLPSQLGWVWTTSDGRTFKNVIIQKIEADRVTIYHDQGSAVVDISSLPDGIKSQLNYDPDLAAQASAARSAAATAAPVTQ